jgi:hypothetical protein
MTGGKLELLALLPDRHLTKAEGPSIHKAQAIYNHLSNMADLLLAESLIQNNGYMLLTCTLSISQLSISEFPWLSSTENRACAPTNKGNIDLSLQVTTITGFLHSNPRFVSRMTQYVET